MKRCKGKTKTNDQCKNNAIPGTDYCYLKTHNNGKANFAKILLNYFQNNLVNFIALAITLAALFFYFQDKKIESNSGILTSNTEAKTRIIAVGSTRFIIDDPNDVFLTDNGESIIKLKIINNKLLVSTVLRNSNGELIAELVENEWKLNKNSIFDRNYTNEALEVKDENGDIVLQVVNFGNVIYLAGKFYCRSGKGFSFIPLKEGGAYLMQSKKGEILKAKLDPIFNYPSETHLGECFGLSELKTLVDSGIKGYRLGSSLEICK